MYVFPQKKAEAFVQALPVIAGGVALGALGVAAVADFAGAEGVAEDINSFGQKAKDFAIDTSIGAATAVTGWIMKDKVSDPPDLKFDYSNVDSAVGNQFTNYMGNVTANYQADSIGKADAKTTYGDYDVTPYQATNPVKMSTSYPEFSAGYDGYYTASQHLVMKMNNFDATNANSRIFMISYKGEIYFTNSFTIKKDTYRTVQTASGFTYQLSQGLKNAQKSFTLGISNIPYSKELVDVVSYPTVETALPILMNNLKALGATFGVTVTTVGAMNEVFQKKYDNTVAQTYEKYKQTGITINGQAILEANPTITWDGTTQDFVEKDTGKVVDPTTLNLPNVGVYDGTVAVPVGDTYAPVDTGVVVGEGAGTVPDAGTGDSDGILTGLWDFLKGILQSILDGILAVVEYVKNLTLIGKIITLIEALEIPNPLDLLKAISTSLSGFWEDVGAWFGDVIEAIPSPTAILESIGNFSENVGEWFGDVIKAIPSPTAILETIGSSISGFWDDVVTGFGEVIGAISTGFSYVNPLSENFFLTLALVPEAGFMSDFFKGLQNEFNMKIPLISDLTNFFKTVTGITFSSKIPEFKITLPDSLGGGTYSIIDFGFFSDYRTIIVNFIRFTAWFVFLKRLYARIPRMIY